MKKEICKIRDDVGALSAMFEAVADKYLILDVEQHDFDRYNKLVSCIYKISELVNGVKEDLDEIV